MASDHPRSPSLPDTQSIAMPRPKQLRPIIVIGAGGIVRAAHLPAYAKGGYSVIGIMDEVPERAESLAAERGIPRAFRTLDEAIRFAPPDTVFDVAVPASQLVHILPHFRDGSAILMQKPMGDNLAQAETIRDLCRSKHLTASVNFSLRYSPNNLAVRALAAAGLLGEIHDIEVQTSTYTPWQLWTFLAVAPRLEILYHSIHYFDLIRSWLGNPRAVSAKTVKSPQTPNLAPTKTVAILDYGDSTRVFVATNHSHNFGTAHQHSFVQWEGLNGAARMTMGLNLDYQSAKPDSAEYAPRGYSDPAWIPVPISGNNFPDGFIGTMGELQAYVEGSVSTLPTHFDDAYQTMALIEALYQSSENGAAWVSLKG
ncbi:Gfo/Idh/MocA family protein [Paracidobacterium acidisoli]|uniref:Gfo/Idh/MocA family oxidoreductase n=1 Tax=Paracidobacterium acidisoli TaxID=2303751 RepID=A0A372ISG4_9BACT|nr:Gfo/Idh/MocA family oxidoreductase [Paracidobacterium acidisoli]MBT9330844.1 Gfo/Idh/MocA family oxidoreductase [Paracidobacterium acidisoli]